MLAALRRAASPETRAGLKRFGIPDDRALGVAMRDMKSIAKPFGKDQPLADALWDDGGYEARTAAVFVADPVRLTRARADAWVAAFDSWAIADTAAFHLFDRTPFAWAAAPDWLAARPEFTRRAGLALYWALALHDRGAPDAAFLDALGRIEAAEPDPRPLVRKAADMALGAIGRRNAALHAAARATAGRMAVSNDPSPAWIGRAALRDLDRVKPRR